MNIEIFEQHLATQTTLWREVMQEHDLDAVVLPAGKNRFFTADDQEPPFHAYPHFLRWVPEADCENSVLLIAIDEQPKLFWFEPKDFWYLPTPAPSYCGSFFDVRVHGQLEALHKDLGDHASRFSNLLVLDPTNSLPTEAKHHSPIANQFVSQLDYFRSFKTEFELECMQSATRQAVLGHLAAEGAFREGGSEYDIHLAYLRASNQNEANLPYPNIVALNKHAATLHYQRYDRQAPNPLLSLLIDSGAKSTCYHADVTRTYAHDQNHVFQDLIQALDTQQQALISTIRVDQEFEELHREMSLKIAQILVDFGIFTCSAEAAEEQELVDVFFPHGLGHLLGLQTHDVGGLVTNSAGSTIDPHPRYTSLRLRRTVQESMTFTIEPGIYFIPVLLKSLNNHKDVNWQKVESFIPYGGIRIEDNVFVRSDGVSNLTREAFSEHLV